MRLCLAQDLVVLCKYLIEQKLKMKLFCLLTIFPKFAQNSLRIPLVFHVCRVPQVLQVFQVCDHSHLYESQCPNNERGQDLTVGESGVISDVLCKVIYRYF